MVSLFCANCKRNTKHYFMRLLNLYECDECGMERKG